MSSPAGDDEEVTEQGDNRRQAAPQPAPSESLQKKAPMQQLNRKPNSRVSSSDSAMHCGAGSDVAVACDLLGGACIVQRAAAARGHYLICVSGLVCSCRAARHISFPDVSLLFFFLYASPVAR
jgi:CO dehydrogenase/acetyl-CoA synthase alpha subunit